MSDTQELNRLHSLKAQREIAQLKDELKTEKRSRSLSKLFRLVKLIGFGLMLIGLFQVFGAGHDTAMGEMGGNLIFFGGLTWLIAFLIGLFL